MAVDISNPGADLLGDTESRVLLALARRIDPISGRQVAKLIGHENHMSARRALDRLERIGLVTATELSNSRLYELNREHLYWEAVLNLLQAPARLDELIEKEVVEHFPARTVSALFGSVARGDAVPDSDIDILIVIDGPLEHLDGIDDLRRELVAKIEKATGNVVQVLIKARDEIDAMVADGDPLALNWQKDARYLTPSHAPFFGGL